MLYNSSLQTTTVSEKVHHDSAIPYVRYHQQAKSQSQETWPAQLGLVYNKVLALVTRIGGTHQHRHHWKLQLIFCPFKRDSHQQQVIKSNTVAF